MEPKIPNKVIVIGGNHHNALGIIRSLGQNGVNVYLIVTEKKKSFITKSKYVSQYWNTTENEEEIIKILIDNFNDEREEPIIVPSSDKAANIIDKNFNLLSKKYILPNCGNKEGYISYLMNKEVMCKIASSLGLRTPKTWVIDLNEEDDILLQDIIYPCIMKPLRSVDGHRQDIIICEDYNDTKVTINKFRSMGYHEVLIQQFIKKEKEVGIVGCVTLNSKEIIIPGIIKKLREFPLNSGSSSFAKVDFDIDKYLDVGKIKKFLYKIQYYGIFDMEFLYSNKKLYFIEINFRNGGNSYALTKAGANVVYLWCLDAAGYNISNKTKKIEESLYFMMDTRDFRHVINGDLNLFKWILDFFRTKAFLVFNIKDIKPFIFKFLYH